MKKNKRAKRYRRMLAYNASGEPTSLLIAWRLARWLVRGLFARAKSGARRLVRIIRGLLLLLTWPFTEAKLKSEYVKRGLHEKENDFVFYRVIGNDLVPRHKMRQSLENVRFVLEYEPELDNCEKRWVINRIIDPGYEREIIQILEDHKQHYFRIPFIPEEYGDIGFDTDVLPPDCLANAENGDRAGAVAACYRLKNNYVMNNNGARNAALREGRSRGKWVMPWDGNCFITQAAWQGIVQEVTRRPWLQYFVVPMVRLRTNADLLHPSFVPEPTEEPQIIFRQDTTEEFNENFSYGRRPKIELFWRLGIPGKWTSWQDAPWDQKRRPKSRDLGHFGFAGWVARLSSGMEHLELKTWQSWDERGRARRDAIVSTLQQLDVRLAGALAAPHTLQIFDHDVLEQEVATFRAGRDPSLSRVAQGLISDAEQAMSRGPYSVTHKTSLPPSGDRRDYWHPAPYWWPNSQTYDGLPYIYRDGERVPGTDLFGPESDNYDRTRLQLLFDDTMILALAWKFTGEDRYANKAVDLLKCFFVDPETRMNPHLKFAQVRLGHNSNLGSSAGIIEMKDLYYYLDAVRLLFARIEPSIIQEFTSWLGTYLEWLLNSEQGKRERRASNNHGTYYDLQVAAVSAFIGNYAVLYETLLRAKNRIAEQFAQDGSQPLELLRTNSLHYCCFSLQGWMNLAEISSRYGVDLWKESPKRASGLERATRWLLGYSSASWPFPQADGFDAARFYPIWFSGFKHVGLPLPPQLSSRGLYCLKLRFWPHDGIRPYWNLGLLGGERDIVAYREHVAGAEAT